MDEVRVKNLGRKIRYLRHEMGLTQADLREKSGCGVHLITLLERDTEGRILSSAIKLKNIADVLGVTLDYLLDDNQPLPKYRMRRKEVRKTPVKQKIMKSDVLSIYLDDPGDTNEG